MQGGQKQTVTLRTKSVENYRDKQTEGKRGRGDSQQEKRKMDWVCPNKIRVQPQLLEKESQTSAVLNASLTALLKIYQTLWECVNKFTRNPVRNPVDEFLKGKKTSYVQQHGRSPITTTVLKVSNINN